MGPSLDVRSTKARSDRRDDVAAKLNQSVRLFRHTAGGPFFETDMMNADAVRFDELRYARGVSAAGSRSSILMLLRRTWAARAGRV